ncbi:MAG: hypothetical protein KBC08_03075 [Caldisericia bacterium]|jgi:hypothetical protein|nr:hypothetical protein [Caldisericia bacterium]
MGRAEKIASWTKENRFFVVAGVLIVLCVIIVIPIFAQSLNRSDGDYSTPALYLFSTIAQTMGAILGIVCAAFFAIFANMRASKDDPTLEVSKRLLVRDQSFLSALGFGLITILVAVVSLIILYFSSNSQNLSGFFLTNVALINFTLGLLSIAFLLDFVINKIRLYMHPVHLFDYLYEKHKDTRDINKAIDIAELGLLLVGMAIDNKNAENSLIYISSVINLNMDNHKAFLDSDTYEHLKNKIEEDICHLQNEDQAYYWSNMIKPITLFIRNNIITSFINNKDIACIYLDYVINIGKFDFILKKAYIHDKYYCYYDKIVENLDDFLCEPIKEFPEYNSLNNLDKQTLINIIDRISDYNYKFLYDLLHKYYYLYNYTSMMCNIKFPNLRTEDIEFDNPVAIKFKLLFTNSFYTLMLLHSLFRVESEIYQKVYVYFKRITDIINEHFREINNNNSLKSVCDTILYNIIYSYKMETRFDYSYMLLLLLNICETLPPGLIQMYEYEDIANKFDITFAYFLFVKIDKENNDKSFSFFMDKRLSEFLGGSMSPNIYEKIREKYEKNKPFIDQYVSNMYLKNMFY